MDNTKIADDYLNDIPRKKEFKIFSEAYGDNIRYSHLGYEDPRIIKWYTGLKNFVAMPVEFDEYALLKLWCLENCEYPVAYFERHSLIVPDIVYFLSERDAMAFKLRWT